VLRQYGNLRFGSVFGIFQPETAVLVSEKKRWKKNLMLIDYWFLLKKIVWYFKNVGSVFSISVQFFGYKPNRRITNIYTIFINNWATSYDMLKYLRHNYIPIWVIVSCWTLCLSLRYLASPLSNKLQQNIMICLLIRQTLEFKSHIKAPHFTF